LGHIAAAAGIGTTGATLDPASISAGCSPMESP